jgi:Domain of unknown function (DUF4262)
MDNTEDERIAQLMREQDAIIDRVGWAVVSILPHDPDDPTVFAYTVGLTAHHYPELIIAGLPPHIAHSLLNDMAGRVYDQARRFHHGERITDLIACYDAVIVDGDATDVLLPGAANARYGPDQVRLQQIVWPDPQSRYPWDDGYSLDPRTQPVIAHP